MDRLLSRSFAQTWGIDFANSLPSSPRADGQDPLKDGVGLMNWLDRAQLGPSSNVVLRWLDSQRDELDAVAERVRLLRKWFRDFVCENLGRSLTSADLGRLKRLNALVSEERRFYQIVEADDGRMPLALRFSSPWNSPESALIRIGEMLAIFICEVDFARIGICEGRDCSLIFVDRSRALARRWCSMASCGNRSKQSTVRGRAKLRYAGG
jgi:predicted RNA-binding Zn ribbon-like protein